MENHVPLHLYLGFHWWDFPEMSCLAFPALPLQNMLVWLRSVIRALHLEHSNFSTISRLPLEDNSEPFMRKVMYFFGCMSASLRRIFLELRTSHFQRMRNK